MNLDYDLCFLSDFLMRQGKDIGTLDHKIPRVYKN